MDGVYDHTQKRHRHRLSFYETGPLWGGPRPAPRPCCRWCGRCTAQDFCSTARDFCSTDCELKYESWEINNRQEVNMSENKDSIKPKNRAAYIQAICAMRDALPECFKTNYILPGSIDAATAWAITTEQLETAEDCVLVDVYSYFARESLKLAGFEKQVIDEQRAKDGQGARSMFEFLDLEDRGARDQRLQRALNRHDVINNFRKAKRELEYARDWVGMRRLGYYKLDVSAEFSGPPQSLAPYLVESIKADFDNIAARAVVMQSDALAALKEESEKTLMGPLE